MIGVAHALNFRGELDPGTHTFETPAGLVRATLFEEGAVEVENVASRRVATTVPVLTSGGPLRGDICFGGNWFFHLDPSPVAIEPGNLGALLALTREVRLALSEAGITGDDEAEIDHVGLFEPRDRGEHGCDARNFVLCPGGAYDRSPCGTGMSAWLARLHARGRLDPGEIRIVESVIGSRFSGRVSVNEAGEIIPTIRGSAAVVAELSLVFEDADPYLDGLPR